MDWQAQVGPHGRWPVNQARILIVDDEPFNLDVLQQELEFLGHVSVRATDGEEALERLKVERFDLALLDVMMPRLDGYGLLERMKSEEAWRHIPVVMISALTDLKSAALCIARGAEDYLFKPFNPTLLRARVGASLERKRLHDEVTARTRELTESLEQQTATSEVLQVISSSPATLEPVFETILANAARICEAKFGVMYLKEGSAFRTVVMHNAPPALAEMRRRNPVFRPNPRIALARAAATKQTVQIADVQAEPGYLDPLPGYSGPQIVTVGGARTVVAVPMLKKNELVGVIAIYRQEVRPFTDKQIELVTNFAAQAVIAIENTRLLSELRQRTDDLSEALGQQTATSEVLSVISSSPGELEPVFQSMLRNATRLCEAESASLILREGSDLRIVARYNAPAALLQQMERDPIFRPGPASGLGRSIRLKQVVQVPDIVNDQAYFDREPARVRGVEAGYRSQLSVPLIKDNEAIGAFNILRRKTGLFTEKQIELVSNFTRQAVIAIENTRLLNELRQSLQQQTATADVLKVISRSTFDLKTVLQTLVESAARLCE